MGGQEGPGELELAGGWPGTRGFLFLRGRAGRGVAEEERFFSRRAGEWAEAEGRQLLLFLCI